MNNSLTALFCALFLMISHLRATTLAPLELSQMVENSNAIATGSVTSRNSKFVGGHVWSVYTVVVSDYLKGDGPEKIQVSQPGGSHGKYSTQVSGTRDLKIGDTYCLFLWMNPQGEYQILGMAMGSLPLQKVNNEFVFKPDHHHFFLQSTQVAKSLQKISTKSTVKKSWAKLFHKPGYRELRQLIKDYDNGN